MCVVCDAASVFVRTLSTDSHAGFFVSGNAVAHRLCGAQTVVQARVERIAEPLLLVCVSRADHVTALL